jgi:hypothetical protein
VNDRSDAFMLYGGTMALSYYVHYGESETTKRRKYLKIKFVVSKFERRAGGVR